MKSYVFGECSICGQGHLLAFKNGATGELLVMCDYCESRCRNPADAKSFDNALTDESTDVRLASMADAQAAGWAPLATGVIDAGSP
jgi:hypothetical protein